MLSTGEEEQEVHNLSKQIVILRPSFSASDWPNNRLTFLNVTRSMLHGKEFVRGSNSRTPALGIELLITQVWSICANHYATDATLKLGKLQAYYCCV